MSQNNDKEKPAGSQSLFRGLMLIEILSNYPNGCPLAHLSELAGLNKSTVPGSFTHLRAPEPLATGGGGRRRGEGG
ncbi:helix-turn-helix domain-containing protein, partial [Salmonella enterica]|uniref:helix-turn-helix domain-containing protein n=1 Tax=Salmonella enterica TaxID=28901 RepID=UPI001F1FE023